MSTITTIMHTMVDNHILEAFSTISKEMLVTLFYIYMYIYIYRTTFNKLQNIDQLFQYELQCEHKKGGINV